jgi:MarR family transcriptional regulator, organic hydroperoxide resistance regulator
MKRPAKGACEAWQLLVRFSFAHRAALPALAAELELSPAQCHLLNLLEPNRSIAMGQLAGALACDASNVTGLVDRLESRGLVERRPSAGDRRVKVLTLTPLGAKLRAAFVERMTSPPATLQRLTRSEQQALVDLLRRLVE